MSAACPVFGFDEVMKLHAYLAKQFQTHQSKLVRTGFINGIIECAETNSRRSVQKFHFCRS